MTESDERLLNDYFQELNMDIEVVPEIKLDAAIRSGMQHGRNKKIILRRGYTAAIIALLFAALFVILPWAYQASRPEHSQLPPKSWGELEVYRQVIGDNMTIRSALDAGFVQQVNITSPEVNGLQMTINGVIADRQGIILLYTVENHTGKKMLDLGFTLKKNESSLVDLNENISLFDRFKIEEASLEVSREYRLIPWKGYQETLPNKIHASLSLLPSFSGTSATTGDTKVFKLEAMIDLDDKAKYSLGRNIKLKDTLSIAGQKIIIDEVYIGPTGIYMPQRYGGENTMKIFFLLGTQLTIGKGDRQEELKVAGTLTKGGLTTSVYHNNNMRPDEPISLGIEGISALDKSKLELVINTEAGQILKAPDEYLSLSKRMVDVEPGILFLDYFIPKEGGSKDIGRGFSLDDNFTDGTGSGHWLGRVMDDYSSYKEFIEDASGSTVTVVINVGEEKLPQPLTFKVSSYPNLIMYPDSVRIR